MSDDAPKSQRRAMVTREPAACPECERLRAELAAERSARAAERAELLRSLDGLRQR